MLHELFITHCTHGTSVMNSFTFIRGKPWHVSPLSLLETVLNNNLKFISNKIQFKTRESEFSGQHFIPDSMSVDSNRFKESWCYQMNWCTTVQKGPWKLPSMMNYLNHYSSWITQLAEPLKEPLMNNTLRLWNWISEGLWGSQEWADHNQSASILWPKGRQHHKSGWVHEGPRFGATTESQTCHICIQNINTSRDRVLSLVFGLGRLHYYVFDSKIKVRLTTNHQ